MIALYFPEITFENVEWAETLMGVARSQIDNAIAFWFPADNTDRDAPAVPEPAVKFAHNALALR
ncbi:hypothetical protein AC791_15535 [Klebsiella sp. RIT-PI-d]|nr:hypothetical protein AC791_15535 [Klebsiella sp. RIT-PI-d]